MTKKKHTRQDQPQDEPRASAPSDGASALADERDDLLGRLQRVSADYLNYQKRIGREIADARDLANAELMKDLLAVLDDMERALDHAAEDDPLAEGMQLVYDKALEIMARFGLKPIEAQGQVFDPQRHEAMMAEPAQGCDVTTVLRELQRGYEFKGRVLRPARVVISAPPAQGAVEQDGADEDEEHETDTTSESD